MSLFACEQCNVVENTALCGFIFEDGHRRLICSQCNPQLGEWHGIFPREDANEAGYVQIPNTKYIRLDK